MVGWMRKIVFESFSTWVKKELKPLTRGQTSSNRTSKKNKQNLAKTKRQTSNLSVHNSTEGKPRSALDKKII